MKKNIRKIALAIFVILLITLCTAIPVFAAEGDVSGAVENTWIAARSQIKDVTNKVIFPVIDVILAILFFVKVATSYLEYRKHGQFEWAPIAILFACLVFSLTCPLYIWTILGM
ncbi:MAG: DUF3852 domain-containing protein [Clostridia bacterium]|nr:DUF3852 domain-containing protein [Clostridia bacterium]